MSAAMASLREEPVPLAQEDLARADLYALIARLLYSPDEQLLRSISSADEILAETANAPLEDAWRALSGAAKVCNAESVQDEYQRLFIGIGRPEVMLFASYYLAGFMMEKPLALLRDDLARLGFALHESVTEPEDHVSALCDVMRYLIAGDEERDPASLEQQKQFFTRHIQTWYERFCNAVIGAESANFYRSVGQFTKAFFDIEAESFEIL